MKANTLLLFLLFTTPLAFAQTTESINTDRPGQTTNPHTVGTSVSQLQYGINYFDPNTVNSTILIRYGFIEKFEVNAGYSSAFEYLDENYATLRNISRYQYGTTHINIGARYNILQTDGYKPGIGIQGTVFFDINDYYLSTGSFYNFILSADQKLVKDLRIGGNIISEIELALNYNYFRYTSYLSYSYEDFSFLAELYGDLDRDLETSWDFGVSYQYNSNMLIDINYGKRRYNYYYFGPQVYWNAEIGLTYRIPKN